MEVSKEAYLEHLRSIHGDALDSTLDGKVILPCHCGEDICKGWAIILDDPWCIAQHGDGTDNAVED